MNSTLYTHTVFSAGGERRKAGLAASSPFIKVALQRAHRDFAKPTEQQGLGFVDCLRYTNCAVSTDTAKVFLKTADMPSQRRKSRTSQTITERTLDAIRVGAGWAPYLKDTNVLLGFCLIVAASFAAFSLKSMKSSKWFAALATAGVFAIATLVVVVIWPGSPHTKNATATTDDPRNKSGKVEAVASPNATEIKQGDAGSNTVQIVNGSGNLVLNQAGGK